MKWEYTSIDIKTFDERIGSGISASVWELIAIYKGTAYFKRPKPTPATPDYRKDTEVLSRQKID